VAHEMGAILNIRVQGRRSRASKASPVNMARQHSASLFDMYCLFTVTVAATEVTATIRERLNDVPPDCSRKNAPNVGGVGPSATN